jgi:hypothetical protein
MDNEFAQDIDVAQALELLPKKIADRKAVISELALEHSVAEAVDFPGKQAQLDALTQQMFLHKRFLTEYERRLEAIKAAVKGE